LKYLKAELSVSDTIMSSLVKDLLGNLFGTNIKKSLKNLAEPNLTLAQVTHTNCKLKDGQNDWKKYILWNV
jgi:protein-L-isoaspartate O-methyltransferase